MSLLEDLLERTKYLGKHRAQVKAINDPKKLRRIKVLCPFVSHTELSHWALPCDSIRRDWLPELDDIVWIEFEGGSNVDFPIYTGLAVAKSDVDPGFLLKYGSTYRKDRDPNGNSIEWTDAGFIMKMLNQSPTGKFVFEYGVVQIEFSLTGMKIITPAGTYDALLHTHTTPVGPSGPPVLT